MKNSITDSSIMVEERIGKTVFFVGTKQSEDAKGSLEDKLKNLMINALLMDDHILPA